MAGLQFDSGISSGYSDDLRRMQKETDNFEKNTIKTGNVVNNTFASVKTTVTGLIGTFATFQAGKEILTFSSDLETALTEVSTISQEVTNNFKQYQDSILALSTESATGAATLTNAFYDVVSAGYDGAEGLQLLASAEKASTAGFVEVGTAADGLTTVLNAWGKTADQATGVSDIFFKTVEKGKTTFPELASNIAQAAPIAASLGVSFEEVSGAIATLTKQGTPTAQAITQIRSSLLAVTEVLGDGWAETLTYQEALGLVREKAGGSTNTLKEMLGRVEAVNAVLGLTGKNASTAASDLNAMNEALGATQIAANKVTETTDVQIKILKNNILASFSSLGNEAVGVIGNISKGLNDAFKAGDVERYTNLILKLSSAFVTYKVSVLALSQIQKLRATQAKVANDAEAVALARIIPIEERRALGIDNINKLTTQQVKLVKEKVLSQINSIKLELEGIQASRVKAVEEARASGIKIKAINTEIAAQRKALIQDKANANQEAVSTRIKKLRALQTQKETAIIAKSTAVTRINTITDKANTTEKKLNTLQTKLGAAADRSAAVSKNLLTTASYKLGKAFKSLRAAFLQNPIGILITGLTIVIPLIQEFTEDTDNAADSQSKLNKELEKTNELIQSFQKIQKQQQIIGLFSLDELKAQKQRIQDQLKAEKELNRQLLGEAKKKLQEDATLQELSVKIRDKNIRDELKAFLSNQYIRRREELVSELEQQEKLRQIRVNSLNAYLKDVEEAIKKQPETQRQLTEKELKAQREKALKQLELENQQRKNSLIKRYGNEEKLQDEFNKKLLENELLYLKERKKILKDNLEKAKIDEQILNINIELEQFSEKGILNKLLKEYETYVKQREELETNYRKKIEILTKKGYTEEAKLAKIALQDEIKQLNQSLLSRDKAFQEWYKYKLPALTKKGVNALNKELDRIKIGSQVSGLDIEKVVAYQEQLRLINEELRKKELTESTSNANWDAILRTMNDVNEFIGNINKSFEGMDKQTRNVLEGITNTIGGVINLGKALQAATAAITTLEKASAILAIISAALQVTQAISNAFENARKIREEEYVKELQQVQAVNLALLQQNKLYKEGNEIFADDKWGTALRGLQTYNKALELQKQVVIDLGQTQKESVTSFGKKALGSLLNPFQSIGNVFGAANERKQLNAIEDLASQYETRLEKALATVAVKTKSRGKIGKFFGRSDQYESLLKLYPQLIDLNGELDTILLQSIIDTRNLSGEDKQRLTSLIELTNQAREAYDQFGNYIASIFGGVGDEVTKAFQDMYEGSDDAIQNLEKSFSDMIESFTRDAIEFAFLQPFLKELNDTTKELGKQFAKGDITSSELQTGVVTSLGDFYDKIAALQPEILNAFNEADKLAAKAGFESAFEKRTTDESKQAQEALEQELQERLKSYEEFGESISNIFSSVGQTVADTFQKMYEDGELNMDKLNDEFGNLIESFTNQAVQFSFLQPYLTQLQKTTKELGKEYKAGGISVDELQQGITDELSTFYSALNELQPEILRAYETADRLAEEAGFKSAFDSDRKEQELSRAGQIREAITEETGSELVGRLGALMLSNERIAVNSEDILDYAIQSIVVLQAIKQNTDYLPEIANNTRRTFEKLDTQ